MSEIELRVPLGVGEELWDVVFRRGRHEYVAIGLVSHGRLGDRDVLLLQQLFEIPEPAYRHEAGHGAAWNGAAMVSALGAAMDLGLGIVVFHSHPHDGPPELSGDDRRSASRLIPMFRARVPVRPHASIVLSRTHADGLVAMPGGDLAPTKTNVRWLGSSIIEWPTRETRSAVQNSENFSRQLLVVRDDGQRTLGRARVGIVGLGGGGSHVAHQLAHLGVGEVILVDADRVSPTDRHRLLGLSRLDTWLSLKKTAVMRRVVRRIAKGTQCRAIDRRFPEPEALEALKTADVIVGCLDNLHARADLQELSWRFLIPYVDVGVNIRAINDPEPDGPRVSIGGNVLTLIPGGFCMWCCDFLSKDKLAAELAGANRNYFENRAGEAQVVSLNGVVASQAVTEVLQLLTGFAGNGLGRADVALVDQPTLQRGFRKFDGVRGTLEDWGAARKPDCTFCRSMLAAGVVAWSQPS
jgi:hypothetical protein